jgi:hypothetical protein
VPAEAVSLVDDEESDYRAMLENLYPSATFSVELPFAGNGNLFQVRTTVNSEVFYGRATTEDEAVSKCCKKATRFILQRDATSNVASKVELFIPHLYFSSTIPLSHPSGNRYFSFSLLGVLCKSKSHFLKLALSNGKKSSENDVIRQMRGLVVLTLD